MAKRSKNKSEVARNPRFNLSEGWFELDALFDGSSNDELFETFKKSIRGAYLKDLEMVVAGIILGWPDNKSETKPELLYVWPVMANGVPSIKVQISDEFFPFVDQSGKRLEQPSLTLSLDELFLNELELLLFDGEETSLNEDGNKAYWLEYLQKARQIIDRLETQVKES